MLHLLHWGDVPAYLGIIVTAVFGYLSWRSSRRSKAAEDAATEQANRATKAAEDAVAAENRIADANERSATAHQTQAKLAQDKADAAERYPWRLRRRDRSNVDLTNDSDSARYVVTVTGEQVKNSQTWPLIDGHSSVELHTMRGDDASDEVTVAWQDQPGGVGERFEWRGRPG